MQSRIFSIITSVFSVIWSFRNHSNMLIWCSSNISCCYQFSFRIHLWIEYTTEQHLFEIFIFVITRQSWIYLLIKINCIDPIILNGNINILFCIVSRDAPVDRPKIGTGRFLLIMRDLQPAGFCLFFGRFFRKCEHVICVEDIRQEHNKHRKTDTMKRTAVGVTLLAHK